MPIGAASLLISLVSEGSNFGAYHDHTEPARDRANCRPEHHSPTE
jgi:hypothetical protein